jgi:hypothetical protein
MLNLQSNHVPFTVRHIPYASRVIPRDVRGAIVLSDQDLEGELRKMTDSSMDELFRIDPELALSRVLPVSRLVVDPEQSDFSTIVRKSGTSGKAGGLKMWTAQSGCKPLAT